MKRVRLTVVYRTSREVRSYSIKALAKKSRHLKLLQCLQKTVRVSNKKVHKSFRKHARSATFTSLFEFKALILLMFLHRDRRE